MASLNLVSSYGSVFRPLSAVFVAPWVTPTVPCRRCKRCRCRCRGLSSGSCSIMWRSFIDAAKYSGPEKNRWRQTLPLPNRRMQISRSHALQTDLTTVAQATVAGANLSATCGLCDCLPVACRMRRLLNKCSKLYGDKCREMAGIRRGNAAWVRQWP